MDKKTVYVLGAGFSAPAGAPNQAAILKRIYELTGNEKVITAQTALQQFLSNVMFLSDIKAAETPLEDIYTPIDRCLADGVALRGYSPSQLRNIRADLEYLISLSIDRAIEKRKASDLMSDAYIGEFAHYLTGIAYQRARLANGAVDADRVKAYDPFSVISLNWDILLDKALYSSLNQRDMGLDGDYDPIGVVDYCCYISSLAKDERRIRSGLWALGSRGYNVKLLKIHGSMNWLQCSNCQRLFVGFEEKVTIPNFINAELCRHCARCGTEAKLQGSLVMPTFLKDLTNFQIKLVWQNAAVELMEGKKIVFIGYSLPFADFEFRQVLSRMVRKDAEIEVILYRGESDEAKKQYEEECRRYQQFFGNRRVNVEPGGVVSYVKTLTGV